MGYSIPQLLIITDQQTLSFNLCFEGAKYDMIIQSYFLIIQGLKIQDGCQFWPKIRSRHQIN